MTSLLTAVLGGILLLVALTLLPLLLTRLLVSRVLWQEVVGHILFYGLVLLYWGLFRLTRGGWRLAKFLVRSLVKPSLRRVMP